LLEVLLVSGVAHQQLLLAENEKRQEAITSVVATEITADLISMHRIVSRIEEENQTLQWLLIRAEELVNQLFMRGYGPGSIGIEFEPAQRRGLASSASLSTAV
jgi:mevalonate kinase